MRRKAKDYILEANALGEEKKKSVGTKEIWLSSMFQNKRRVILTGWL